MNLILSWSYKKLHALLEFFISLEWQAKVVLSITVLAAIYAQFFYPFFFVGGDSDMDLFLARYISGLPHGMYIGSHGPGMAIYLILSGVVSPFHTWKILIFSYALMYISMPCLIYGALRPYTKNWALMVAIITCFGIIGYSRVETYDHLFLFLEFLCLYLVSKFYLNHRNQQSLLFIIALTAYALTLVKPVAFFIFWIFLFYAFFLPGINRRRLFLAAGVYLALMGAWVLLVYNDNSSAPRWASPSNAAERIFARTYYKPHHFMFTKNNKSVIQEFDGPASMALYKAVRSWAIKSQHQWSHYNPKQYLIDTFPYPLFGRYKNHPEALVQALFKHPNSYYFHFIRDAAKKYNLTIWKGHYGRQLLYAVGEEHGDAGIDSIIKYLLLNPMKLITGATVSMGWRNLLGAYTTAFFRSKSNVNMLTKDEDSDRQLLNLDSGPYSKEYFADIRFFTETTQLWQQYGFPYTQIKSSALFFDAILNPTKYPNKISGFYTIWEGWYYTLFMNIFGATTVNDLFSKVTLEIFKNHPNTYLFFVDNFIHRFFSISQAVVRKGSINNFSRGGFCIFGLCVSIRGQALNYTVRTQNTVNWGKHLRTNLTHKKIFGDEHSQLIATFYEFMHIVAPIFVLLGYLTLIFSMLSNAKLFASFLLTVHLCMVLIFTFFGAFGAARYADMYLFLPMMLTAINFGTLHQAQKAIKKMFSKSRA